MSRSYRRSPFVGICNVESEAYDKRLWHKRFRGRERMKLKTLVKLMDRWDGYLTTHHKDVSDTWGMSKDGRRYWRELSYFTWFKRQKNEFKLKDPDAFRYYRKWHTK